ncbi:post-PEP-CTERM-1 domain-containing protein [Dyella sp. 2RAB6]|uniref:post-PEP-CTERM-1 domain-containing protein n=1 Tax=Dyella sp. 2RAB6 TaxID=3232992 RepID=UPI003F93F26D
MNNKQGMHAMTLALMTFFAATAMAQQHPAAPAPDAQVTFRDPVTGQIREPTAEELAQLSRAMQKEQAIQGRSAVPHENSDTHLHWRTVRLANGVEAKVAEVPERLQSQLVAKRGLDGKYSVQHADDTAATAQETAP